jgi:hypothetical protein
MTPRTAVPFVIRREQGVIRGFDISATRDVTHGLLRLEAGRIVAQWSTERETSRAGREIWVQRHLGPVEEVSLPLAGMAGARVRWRLLPWPPRWQLVLRAADLTAFDALAGEARLLLEHPAELVLDLRFADRAVAREFAADVALALAERALQAAEEQPGLPGVGAAQGRLPAAVSPRRAATRAS